MKTRIALVVATLVVGAGLTTSAAAQEGFALKAHYLFNSSAINQARTDTLPASDGISVGAELVLPLGIGVGISAYMAGGVSEFDVETSSLTVLAEANYFLDLPLLPVSPYAGVHAGLGQFSREDVNDPRAPNLEDDRTQLGFQVGVRFQPIRLLGVDAQYRRVSHSAAAGQDGSLSRSQVLIGVTLF